ncbi:unnamed protein product [Ceutorhynchus assimilis]|uniref:C2H2-type domain-containing protein n=1 Tax=Ceutorhynchus assimilis TaxID=467358 RepID=A0A9N9QIR8_9CUCU|nr:unnamed protein product [Ceutorhynchus assimilis]
MQKAFSINQIVDDIGELNNGNSMELDSIVSVADVVKLKSDYYSKNYDEKELCFGKDELEEVCGNAITVKKIDDEALVSKRLNIPTFHKCLNCETHFSTKYQYQRHQCNFNSENYVLKSSQASTDKNIDHSSNEQYKCSVCPKVFANKEHLGSHQKCHNISQCEFCSKNVIRDNRLKIHKENHCKKAENANKFYRSDIVVWKCKKCQEIFSCLQNCKNHQHFCQGKPTSDKDIERTSTEILLQCEFCNRTFIDKRFLLTHQRNHTTAKNFECVNCDKAFDSYPVAVSHWIKKCSEFSNIFYLPKLTYCEYCDKTFKNHALLYNHKIKKRHYTQKLYVSNVEFEDQVTEDNSKENMNQLIEDILETLQVPKNINDQNHGDIAAHFIKKEPTDEDVHQQSILKIPYCDKKPKYQKKSPKGKKCLITTEEGFKWQCEKCIKVFDVIDNLETHRQKQHESVFACSTCPEVFQSARALLTHTRHHKSLKPYVCDICGRSYSQTSHLGQHMRFHQGIKPFACPHEGCEARYTIRPDLKDHICKVHTRERPFKCNVCNKRFLTGSVYYQHRLIHTNDRRYICDACGKKFFRADALNNHKRIHTNERPYPCNICEKYFRQKGDRNKHVRTQHANVHIEHT